MVQWVSLTPGFDSWPRYSPHCYHRATVTCHQQPRPLTWGVSSECLGTRSYETTSRDQRGKIQMFFSSTGACTAAKFPTANHHSQINTQLYSASLIRLIWRAAFDSYAIPIPSLTPYNWVITANLGTPNSAGNIILQQTTCVCLIGWELNNNFYECLQRIFIPCATYLYYFPL